MKLKKLPGPTKVYCAHEYTLGNLGFALWVEPDSPALLQRNNTDQATRRQGIPTLPSTIELELATNPFMRTDQADVIAAVENRAGRTLSSEAQVFRVLRERKDKDYD